MSNVSLIDGHIDKMTDNEIIKRLERCVKCGNRNYDTDIVLDLINRQQARIKELEERK